MRRTAHRFAVVAAVVTFAGTSAASQQAVKPMDHAECNKVFGDHHAGPPRRH